MTYYRDLERWERDPPILAVGWLDGSHPFATGTVSREFFMAFARLAMDPWQPAVAAGVHRCEFCVFTGGPAGVAIDGMRVELGCSNVYVPANDCVYVAPSLALHYIDAHEYVPPESFQQAVLACPPMRSMEYLRALRKHGVNRLRAARAMGGLEE